MKTEMLTGRDSIFAYKPFGSIAWIVVEHERIRGEPADY
jgi:hypothetical protein